jgi:hypothetical protein
MVRVGRPPRDRPGLDTELARAGGSETWYVVERPVPATEWLRSFDTISGARPRPFLHSVDQAPPVAGPGWSGSTLRAGLHLWRRGASGLRAAAEHVAARTRPAKTLALCRSSVQNVWKPQLGHLRLRNIRRQQVERCLRSLAQPQTSGRRSGNSGSYAERRSGSTIDGHRRTLRAALSAAVRRELIHYNPAEGRMDAIPARRPDDGDDLDIWQPAETVRFLRSVATDRLAALYEVAAYAGLRRAELCGCGRPTPSPTGPGRRSARRSST